MDFFFFDNHLHGLTHIYALLNFNIKITHHSLFILLFLSIISIHGHMTKRSLRTSNDNVKANSKFYQTSRRSQSIVYFANNSFSIFHYIDNKSKMEFFSFPFPPYKKLKRPINSSVTKNLSTINIHMKCVHPHQKAKKIEIKEKIMDGD